MLLFWWYIDIDFNNVLLSKKSYKTFENILIYGIAYKPFMGSKLLHIRFDEIVRFIKIYDGIRYLVLFGSRLYDAICNRISYRDWFIVFFTWKTTDFPYVIILMKSVVNKNENNYYYNIRLEKGSYEDRSNRQYCWINVCIFKISESNLW